MTIDMEDNDDCTIYFRYGKSGLAEMELTLKDTDLYDVIEYIARQEGVWDAITASKEIAAQNDDGVPADEKNGSSDSKGMGLVVRVGRSKDVRKMKRWDTDDWEVFDTGSALKSGGELKGANVNWGPNPLENPDWVEGKEKHRKQMEFASETCFVGDSETGEGCLWDLGIRHKDIVFLTPIVKTRNVKLVKVKNFWGRMFSKSVYLKNPTSEEYENYKPSKFMKKEMKRKGINPADFKLEQCMIKFLFMSEEKEFEFGGKVGVKDLSIALNVKPGRVTKRSGWMEVPPSKNKSDRVKCTLSNKYGFFSTFVVYKDKPYMIEKNRKANAGYMLVMDLDDVAKVQIGGQDLVNRGK